MPYLKPLTLYVEKLEFFPKDADSLQPSVRAVDTEYTREQAEQLRAALTDYLENVTAGNFRVRNIGIMVQ